MAGFYMRAALAFNRLMLATKTLERRHNLFYVPGRNPDLALTSRSYK